MDDTGIRGALKDALNLGIGQNAKHICDTDEERVFLVPKGGDGTQVIERFPHITRTRETRVRTVESFKKALAFIPGQAEQVPAYVNMKEVLADLSFDHPTKSNRLVLELKRAEPFENLSLASGWNSQATLHDLLFHGIRTHIDPGLRLQIANLKAVAYSEKEVAIQPSGLGKKKEENAVRVSWVDKDGSKEEEVNIDWLYFGPVLACWDWQVEIPIRLQLRRRDNEMFFSLKMLDFEATMDRYLNEFAAHLETECADLPHVHFLVTP